MPWDLAKLAACSWLTWPSAAPGSRRSLLLPTRNLRGGRRGGGKKKRRRIIRVAHSLSNWFSREPWFERFFVEPEMVLPWRDSEEPYSVPEGTTMVL
ncbi:hypothetical protein EYF80_068292 [Liparis tanakae]|uniref:Uncharacterized protein n=1 Tax=Liparis tanakae TaxID=230148 RepID=A0A4Z2DYV0_9TELE|nr:hypothetical protein EYF80_068292 [Liparis tanakae]